MCKQCRVELQFSISRPEWRLRKCESRRTRVQSPRSRWELQHHVTKSRRTHTEQTRVTRCAGLSFVEAESQHGWLGRWDCLRTKYGRTTASSERLTPFSLFKPSPGISERPGAQAKAVHQLVSSEFGSAAAISSQSPRRHSQVLEQWKLQAVETEGSGNCSSARLQQCDVVPFRGCGGSHKLPSRTVGEHLAPRSQPDLWISGEPSRPRDTVLWSPCLTKTKIVRITVISLTHGGDTHRAERKRDTNNVLASLQHEPRSPTCVPPSQDCLETRPKECKFLGSLTRLEPTATGRAVDRL